MQVVYPHCCGLDVHKKKLFACVLLTQPDGTVIRHLRSCSTMTADLLTLLDWLVGLQVEIVAMESTGVFWQPVFNLFESQVSVVLVNAHHMKAVPGRKTDVKDSEWIADLLRHGLLQASFLPPKPIRELRELTRYRKTLVQERAQEVNRLQKVLETANLKLSAVASNVVGKSGRESGWMPYWVASRTHWCWLNWREVGYGRSCLNFVWRWMGGCRPIRRSC